jgi:hypothetical protein
MDKPSPIEALKAQIELAAGDPAAGLKEFLQNNPDSSMKIEEQMIIIAQPWGDDTLQICFRSDDKALPAILNEVVLPPLFSAIYHLDERDLELIFIPGRSEEYGRRFDFHFKGAVLTCEFSDCSDRLLGIVKAARPIGPPSHTDHRNLGRFNAVLRRLEKDRSARRTGTSFWIRGIDWDQNEVLELARNMNFYLWYFDRQSPRIQIHERSRLEVPGKIPRYLFDVFPSKISARPLDPFLLQLWESFAVGNVIHRVLYGYQIIEYVGFYQVQEHILQAIRRVLLAPDSFERPREATSQILDAVSEDKLEDAVKIERAVEAYVDHEQLGAAIRRNLPYFSEDHQFDGGFSQPAICSEQWEGRDKKDCKELVRKVANSLRKIRNAIVHSRESRNVNSIAPTLANQDRLYPWLDPMSVVVSNLLLFRETD